jgi:hypothetical protein
MRATSSTLPAAASVLAQQSVTFEAHWPEVRIVLRRLGVCTRWIDELVRSTSGHFVFGLAKNERLKARMAQIVTEMAEAHWGDLLH